MFRFFRRLKDNTTHRKRKGNCKQQTPADTPTTSSRHQQDQEQHPASLGSNNDIIIKSNDPNAPFALASTVSAYVSPSSPRTPAPFHNKSDIAHKIKRRIKSVSASFQTVDCIAPDLSTSPSSTSSSAASSSTSLYSSSAAIASRVHAICLSLPSNTPAVLELCDDFAPRRETTSSTSSNHVAFETDVSGFNALPLELVSHIFSFLPASTHDICNASAVCWSWRELIRSDSSLAARRRQHWRHVNWRAGRFYLRNTLPLKTHPIWQLLPRPNAKDTVFHYSGMDGTVQALDLRSGELTASLTLPSQNFPVLAVNESCTRLVISTKKSNDTYAVEEYDFHSGKLVRSIDCHSGWITCLQFLNDNHVVTGSQDHSLKLWNLDSGECVKQFAGHTAAVTCLQVLKRKTTANAPVRLVSGSQDGSIKIWDVDSGEALHTLPCRFPIFALHAENNLVAAAGCKKENRTSEKGCLKLWNWEREVVLRDIGSQPQAGKAMAPISGVFLSGMQMLTVESGWMSFRCRKFRKTGAIRLWDIKTGALIAKIADFRMREHTNKSQCVVSLLVDDEKNVIVGIEEMEHIKPSALSHIFKIKSMVKVWSLKEGK